MRVVISYTVHASLQYVAIYHKGNNMYYYRVSMEKSISAESCQESNPESTEPWPIIIKAFEGTVVLQNVNYVIFCKQNPNSVECICGTPVCIFTFLSRHQKQLYHLS